MEQMKTWLRPLVVFDWKPYELLWLAAFSSVAVAQTLFYRAGWFDFSVFLSGCLCVVLAAKGHILNYVVGLYNCFAYAAIAHANHLYGEMGLNLFFFAPMAVVGLFLWRRHVTGGRVEMRGLRPGQLAATVLATLVATAVLGYVLSMIAEQKTPYVDASTNVLSVVATVLMALRYREQWLAYILINILSVVMWLARLADGSQEGVMMVIMWSAYLVNAVYGWLNWSRGSRLDAA